MCFQHWYLSLFTEEGKHARGPKDFKTSENYMMWAKAMLFGDERVAMEVLDAESPGEAKRLGRLAGRVPFIKSLSFLLLPAVLFLPPSFSLCILKWIHLI